MSRILIDYNLEKLMQHIGRLPRASINSCNLVDFPSLILGPSHTHEMHGFVMALRFDVNQIGIGNIVRLLRKYLIVQIHFSKFFFVNLFFRIAPTV